MKRIIILLLLIIITNIASARIHDTKEQCIDRYGPVIKTTDNENIYIFTKSGFRIAVHFFDGYVDFIQYTKVNSNVITDDESRKLIEKNREKYKHKLHCRATPSQLTIATKYYLDRFIKKEENEVNDNLLYL